jgi:NAD(P)-dependent dehydrogenase (short-subunit alcohol dehydrogenase family)
MSRRETVVITGASAGVGRAVARRFGRDGARVGLIARGEERLERARREIESAGGEALVQVLDVADPDRVEAAADAVEDRFGPIDVWINNAMVTVLAPVHEVEPRDFRRVTEVTYLGAVHGTQAALRRMRPRDHGTIVQVGSALAYRAIPLQAAYCGAKHALRGFTDSLRTELMHEGSRVHVTMVHLPALNTPQFGWCKTSLPSHPQPVPPIYQPEVAAEAIHFAAHHRRREVWVGASSVQAIAGNKVAPKVADHVLAKDPYGDQQTDLPIPHDRPHNLYQPVPGHQGAHGVFDDRARDASPQLWASEHRAGLAAAAGAVLLGGLGLWWKARAS